MVALLLAGCASYRALPLPDRAALLTDAAHLQVDVAAMPTARLRSHRFGPSDGLDIIEVAMLAVADNPELKARRGDARETRAQTFSAGLQPDPQLALSRDQVMGSPAGATVAITAARTFDGHVLNVPSATGSLPSARATLRLSGFRHLPHS